MLSRLSGRRVFLSVRVRAVIGQVRLSLSCGSSCRAWWNALITPTDSRPNICSKTSSGRSKQARVLVAFFRTRSAPPSQTRSRSRKTRMRCGIAARKVAVTTDKTFPCALRFTLTQQLPAIDHFPLNIQWKIGSAGASVASEQSTIAAWNRRPWRSARETAEIFWHDAFTDSAGETITFRLKNDYCIPRLTPIVVCLRRENCHPFFLLLDVCVKSDGSFPSRGNSVIHHSERVRFLQQWKRPVFVEEASEGYWLCCCCALASQYLKINWTSTRPASRVCSDFTKNLYQGQWTTNRRTGEV